MKLLKDLKEEILANKINNFYVFFGEDYGLRKHYIDKLAENFDTVKVVDTAQEFGKSSTSDSLFTTNTLYIIYNDLEFAKQRKDYIDKLITKINDDMIIMDYETLPENTTLFTEFGEYVTNFANVEDKIAYEFIDSEVSVSLNSKKELAFNCENNYNTILLETDKIKNYAEAQHTNTQSSLDSLTNKGQMIYKYDDFNSDYLMNDILTHNTQHFSYWIDTINKIYTDQLWISLSRIFNDLLIAYLVKKLGKYPGSSEAYKYGLPWSRAKIIRELNIPYEADYLLDMANEIANIDYGVKSGLFQQDKIMDYLMCLLV